MLVQATTPRPIFDPSKHPEYLYIHTLAKTGVSDGAVIFNASTNPETGARGDRQLDPVGDYPIEGEAGFVAYEYVVPFFELFKAELKTKNLRLVPFCTTGFGLTIRSAFRSDLRTYEERRLSFTVLTMVSGGGILRLSDTFFDLANPTFDPWAPNPFAKKLLGSARDPELLVGFNRTHKLRDPGSDARRAARIAEAEANMKSNEKPVKALERPKKPRGLLGAVKDKLLGKDEE